MALNQNINSTIQKEILNKDWIRQSLFVPLRGPNGGKSNSGATSRTADIAYGGQFSYQQFAFADTSLGGNRSMNPKPQFTSFADPNLPSVLLPTVNNGQPGDTASMGMGRYYAEAIDANEQRIYMQFGVPAYNSLTNFFSGYYDVGHANMVNSGEVNSDILYTVAKWAGYITLWAVVPELSVISFLYNTTSQVVADLQRRPLSRFYYMKPTMSLYWTMVTTILNAIAVNMKLSQPLNSGQASSDGQKPPTLTYGSDSGSAMQALESILPKYILNDKGGIDIYRVACRYQRLSDAHYTTINEISNSSGTMEDIIPAMEYYLKNGIVPNSNITPDLAAHIGNVNVVPTSVGASGGYTNSASGTGSNLTMDTNTTPNFSADKAPQDNTQTSMQDSIVSSVSSAAASLWTGISQHLSAYSDFTKTELRDGSAFVSFIVDWDQNVRESFSNGTKSSDIAEQMNETSRTNRNRLYNIAGGNIGAGIVGSAVEGIVKGVTDIVTGLADSVGFSGIAQLGGKAFVDIPDFWDSSTSTLPSGDYTIPLRTPYGCPESILLNIMPTVSMLLAAVSPRSTGRSSYSGPFLCKLWQKGRTQVQLGMITSLSITRGTGNVGWNIHGQPIGVDINFSVTNLSKIMHMPITTDVSLASILTNGYSSMVDEDTNFSDYMAVLGGLDLADQYYVSNRWRLRRAKAVANNESFLSVDHYLTWYSNQTVIGSILSGIAKQGNLSEAIN